MFHSNNVDVIEVANNFHKALQSRFAIKQFAVQKKLHERALPSIRHENGALQERARFHRKSECKTKFIDSLFRHCRECRPSCPERGEKVWNWISGKNKKGFVENLGLRDFL